MTTTPWKVTETATVQEVLTRIDGSVNVLLHYFGACFLCKNFMKETLQSCAEENGIPVQHVVTVLQVLERENASGEPPVPLRLTPE